LPELWGKLFHGSYRLQKSLSDLNGYDPFIHGGTITGLLQILNDAFENPAETVSLSEMKTVYNHLRTAAIGLRRENQWPHLYRLTAFNRLVLAASEMRLRMR